MYKIDKSNYTNKRTNLLLIKEKKKTQENSSSLFTERDSERTIRNKITLG